MYQRFLSCIAILLCLFIMVGCGMTNNPKTSTESEGLTVIRYPLLGNETNEGFEAYYESGLHYPSQSEIVESSMVNGELTLKFSGYELRTEYSKTKKYTDDVAAFLKGKEYKIYSSNEKIDLHIFQDTGALKKLFVYEKELVNSPQIVKDFSEQGLRSAAEAILVDLYGDIISEHLNSYYNFEYARLMKYSNEEQNRYVVCYRAYINNTPTDDVLYVQFSLTGKLWNISAQNYLQYKSCDTDDLISIEQLENEMKKYLGQLGYSKINLRETDEPNYYTMNSSGELYYVMEWEAFQQHTDSTGVTNVEVLAMKASAEN